MIFCTNVTVYPNGLIIYTSDLYDLNNIAWDQNTKVDPQNEHDVNFFLIRSFSL